MGRIARSWELVEKSVGILTRHKSLMFLPVASAIASATTFQACGSHPSAAAGTVPSTKPCGDVKAPDPLNTVASTATPKTPPTSPGCSST